MWMVSTWKKMDFMNLKKQKSINTTVRDLIEDAKGITALLTLQRSIFIYVSFTKAFLNRMSLNKTRKGTRF